MYTGSGNPIIVSVLGPRRVGKTTLINSILSYYSRKIFLRQDSVLIFNREKNLYFFKEIPCDKLSTLISIKASDLICLVVDCYFGLELETFESLALIGANGHSCVLCILNHLDLFANWKTLKRMKIQIKKKLKYELNSKTKMFCLSGISLSENYFIREISNLTRCLIDKFLNFSFYSVKFPYMIVFCLKIFQTKFRNNMILVGFIKGNLRHCTVTFFSFCIPGIGNLNITKKTKKESGNFYNYSHLIYKKNVFSKKNSKFLMKKQFIKKRKFLFFIIYLKNHKKLKKIRLEKKIYFIESNKFITTKIKISSNKIFYITSGKILLKNFLLQKSVKLKIDQFSNDFKFHFDSRYPIIILENFLFKKYSMFLKVTISKHKWNKKELYSNVFYLISVNWSILKSLVVFFKENIFNFKKYHKCIKKKEAHTTAFFFFLIAEPGDSVIGMHGNQIDAFGSIFCILFFGTVLSNNNQKVVIFRKIKFRGSVFKVFKKTALIENVFSNEIQVAKFIGFPLQTTKGTKGVIKNYISGYKPGSFKAKFEKIIKRRETVVLTIWLPIKMTRVMQYNFFFLIPSDLKENICKNFILM